jgi:RAQPRD family integrative conjugative element protein
MMKKTSAASPDLMGPGISRFVLTMLLGIGMVFTTQQAKADQDSEREELSRISYELQRLHSSVANASKQAPTGQRVRFRYDWLLRDLDLMRRGVDEHLDAPQQPRSVPPLKGDYRQ